MEIKIKRFQDPNGTENVSNAYTAAWQLSFVL
jgi:hypothetical protein